MQQHKGNIIHSICSATGERATLQTPDCLGIPVSCTPRLVQHMAACTVVKQGLFCCATSFCLAA